jgi:hypothetical protein
MSQGLISRRCSVATAGLLLAAAAGCSSTGVVPMGPNSYMVSKQSAAGVFGTPNGVRADILREANAFCTTRGEVAEVTKSETKSAIPLARQGSAHLEFKCVPATPAQPAQ